MHQNLLQLDAMKYNYSEISPKQFESLVIQLCYKLLGYGTKTFADGADGGRDARFDGKATNIPSYRDPWTGLTIIQAKHTTEYNKKFSDKDFFGSKSSIVNEEVEKMKRLILEDGMKNYMLFANRKLPAKAHEEILDYMSAQTGLEKTNIALLGIEDIENYLKAFPDIPEKVDLNAFDMPLNIEPDELADVIICIKNEITNINELVNSKPEKTIENIKRTSLEKKNRINNLNSSYSKIIENKMIAFNEISDFLSRPENSEYQEKYLECKSELDEKIRAIKKPEHEFNYIIERIYDLIISRDQDCKTNKRLTKLMLHYMYYICDIGEVENEKDDIDAFTA
ncbi:ABC-three component system protein [Vibrio cholerae]|uniref:ABC-three component system protein n=1 Tax=Vibrio TaxID=662 RepID=UPI001C3E7DAF|nr:ABC-three component system protein [Vibrio cholerae]EIJ0935067.1 restriction endonuclease [Vibrio cholerae]EJL6296833.1 restriction endonuclease [Vibrio cholerae]EKF9168959.1 restriction endonuclease [Vibrio cholerae]EKF9402010.1 restriction endonuclease [Vibrio cholerae]ELF1651956.1 restriction endonuclease [Vibrio cholerae]